MQVPRYQSRAQWLGPSTQDWEGAWVGRVAALGPVPLAALPPRPALPSARHGHLPAQLSLRTTESLPGRGGT